MLSVKQSEERTTLNLNHMIRHYLYIDTTDRHILTSIKKSVNIRHQYCCKL